MLLIRDPSEDMKTFNSRLQAACLATPVTGVKLYVIHGQPAVFLFSEIMEAEEEDIEEGLAEAVGDTFTEQGPFMVKVMELGAKSKKQRDHTEAHFQVILDGAEGQISGVEIAHGETRDWVRTQDGLSQEYLSVIKTYGAILWEIDAAEVGEAEGEEEDEDEGDDGDEGEEGDEKDAPAPITPEVETNPAPEAPANPTPKRRGRPPKARTADEGDE
jgi:hypothetical protein